MVEKNRIELLKEFGSIKKCELIILSTFSFDPLFFDHTALKEIRKGNPNANVVVLADSNHVSIKNCTDITGLDYRIITIPSTFHPKIFAFCGHGKMIAFIGSHNLTLAGFSHNLELTCKTKDQDIILQCLDCIRSVLTQFLSTENPLLRAIERQMKGEHGLEKPKELRIIHNLECNILDQAISFIKESKLNIREVKIISPFYSKVRSLVKKMKDQLHPSTIYLCVQKNNHTLDPKWIENLRYVSTLEVRAKKQRRIHAKIVFFKSSGQELALVGSPNFTGAALDKVYKPGKGNFEVALLVEGKRISELLSELDFHEISSDQIEESRVRESQIRSGGYPYNIVSASYDIFGSLQLDFYGSSDFEKAQVNIQPLDEENPTLRCHIDLNSESTQIILQPKEKIESGSTIWLSSEEGTQISNKTCINVLRHVRRYSLPSEVGSVEKILRVLANSKTLEDLLGLILSLWPSEDLSRDGVLAKASGSREHPQEAYAYPSRMKTRKGTGTDILEVLEDLFRLRHHRRYGISTRRTLSPVSHANKRQIEDRIKKLPTKFAKFFKIKKLSTANDPDTYALYVVFSLKLCEVISETFQLEELLQTLLVKTMSKFPRLYESYSLSKGDGTRLLSLLIFVQTQRGISIRKRIIEEIADKCSISLSDLLKHDLLEKMGLSVFDEEAYLNMAENTILSTIRKKIDFWKHFVPDSSMIESLSEYYRSLITGCGEIPKSVFANAIAGDEWSRDALYEKNCYPVIGNDGIPMFNTAVTPNQVLQKTYEILRPGFKIFEEEENMQKYLKRVLLEEIERLLNITALEAGCRFVPGRIIAKIRLLSPSE